MQSDADAINPIDYFATGAGARMITIPQLTAHALGSVLAQETKDLFGSSPSGLTKLVPFAARLTLECIGNGDALYHNIDHTMLVTLVGHDILVGRALQRTTTVSDYANFILACLTHDIGYVRGVVQGDEDDAYVADTSGGVDATRIARAIEYTRCPYIDTPKVDTDDLNEEEGSLLRAADLIGQL